MVAAGTTGRGLVPVLQLTGAAELVYALGIFVGLEIPLLMRILKDRFAFKDVVANVLTFDYIGALFASLLTRVDARSRGEAEEARPA